MSRFILCGFISCVIISTPVRADEAKAIAIVEKLGGKVTRDDKIPGKPVVALELTLKATDADLKALTAFKHLSKLELWGTKVTDIGLKELSASKTSRFLT